MEIPNVKAEKIDNNEGKTKHVHICISGFLSERDDFKYEWKDFINHLKDKQVSCYAIRWKSYDISMFYTEMHMIKHNFM